jgi:hypothetical protein
MMEDLRREAPPGLGVPKNKTSNAGASFDPADWVIYGLIGSVAAGVLSGWRLDDWWIGAAVAAGCYHVALLTIIALKR